MILALILALILTLFSLNLNLSLNLIFFFSEVHNFSYRHDDSLGIGKIIVLRF